MKWRIDRILRAPASAFPVQERTWPSIMTLGQPQFTLDPTASEDDLSRTFGLAIGDPAFSVRWETEPTWEELPSPPWQRYLVDAPWAELVTNLGYGEIALTLRLLPLSEWRRREPLNPEEIALALQASAPLSQRLREALAFTLFEPNGPWHADDELLTGWTQAVRATLHQRRPLTQTLNPNSRWLALGYRLLETLSQQRTHRPTLVEVEAGWRALQPVDGPALPHMFAVVYWGESAYRLLECGDTAGASIALDRQTAATQALITVLPDLADALDGGLWRHHLGQLAYYQGDFPEALRQFQLEWRLQPQRSASALQGRLRRNLSNLLTDLGLLASARRLTEQGLTQQRHRDDPELFKTLGRLGEIQLRQRDYSAARAAYEESWRCQPEARREGRTAVYLGHLALLEQRWAEAKRWYQIAEEADQDQSVSFNPYLVMGCITLAWRQGDRQAIRERWATHQTALDALHDEKVLPAAVAALAVALETSDPELAGRFVERLVDNNYCLEALVPLAHYAVKPQVVAPWLQRIASALQDWQQTLHTAVRDIPELDPDETTAPGQVAARIAAALAANNWGPLATDLTQGFPMNLLGYEPTVWESVTTVSGH